MIYRWMILLKIPIFSGFENPIILDSSYADAFMVKECE
jgi:hypothetical protein